MLKGKGYPLIAVYLYILFAHESEQSMSSSMIHVYKVQDARFSKKDEHFQGIVSVQGESKTDVKRAAYAVASTGRLVRCTST